MATCGYDDDGVKTTRWHLIKDGMFVDYQTTRDQAHLIGQKASHGCSYADSWASVPFQRMPNVSLEPGEKDVSEPDIIAATDDGVYVKGDASYSIDHQRYNFQFSGQTFWEVKNGKITTQLRDVAYQSNTPEFWKSCDMLGGKSTYQLGGAFSDGKGQPSQSNSVSHGCPIARFARVNILNTADGDVDDLDKEQTKALTDRVLSFSKAEQTLVAVNGSERANVRFARNTATTSGASSGYSLAITASFGKRSGTVTTAQFDDASLQRALRNAEEIAKAVAGESRGDAARSGRRPTRR